MKGEKYKTQVVGNGSSYSSIFFFFFYEIWKMKEAKKHAFLDITWKISQNQSFWAITASFFRLHKNNKN